MKNVFRVCVLAALVSGGAVNAATTTPVVGPGGTVHFTGSISKAACTVDTPSQTKEVALGDITSDAIPAAGSTSAAVPFSLDLTGCDIALATTATIGFTGTPDADEPTAIKNNTGTATGVGVQIFDSANALVDIDGGYTSKPLTLVAGANSASFTAKMINTGATLAEGSIDTTATFLVQYQ